MVRNNSAYYVSMYMAWFSMLGCASAAIIMPFMLIHPAVVITSILFSITAIYNLYVAINLWRRIQ